MTIQQIKKLIGCEYIIIIGELPSAIRMIETVLGHKVEYNWSSVNEANHQYQEFIPNCSNCLGINPQRIDVNFINNLEVTCIDVGNEFITIHAKYGSL